MSVNHISISSSLHLTKNSPLPNYDNHNKKNFHIVMRQENHVKINSMNVMTKSNTFTCEDFKSISPKAKADNNNKTMAEKKIIFFDALNHQIEPKTTNNFSLNKEFLFKSVSLSPKKKNFTMSKLGEKTYSPTLEKKGTNSIIRQDKNGFPKSTKDLSNICK